MLLVAIMYHDTEPENPFLGRKGLTQHRSFLQALGNCKMETNWLQHGF